MDFVNESTDIYTAFKPYFDATSLQEEADPSKLNQLKHELDLPQIYHWNEVEAFARIFYKLPNRQNAKDHAELNRWAQPCVDRYDGLTEDDDRTKFRDKLSAFVKLYSFLSQVMPYADPELEKLFSFGKFTLPLLKYGGDDSAVDLSGDVSLKYYRMDRVFSGAIELKEGEAEYVKSPTDVGSRKAEEDRIQLSELIKVLNEKFGTDFTEEDRLFFEQIREKASKDQDVIDTALANPLDKFQLGIRKMIEEFMIERMSENDAIVTKYMGDNKFQAAAFPILAKAIFDSIHAGKE